MYSEPPVVDAPIQVFILLEHFDAGTLTFFRQQYLAGMTCTRHEHFYPSSAAEHEIEFETTDEWEMIHFLLAHPNPWYIFYFKTDEPEEIIAGMVFFNPDKTLILGVEVLAEDEEFYRQKLSADFQSNLLLSLHDGCVRPDSKAEFISWMGTSEG